MTPYSAQARPQGASSYLGIVESTAEGSRPQIVTRVSATWPATASLALVACESRDEITKARVSGAQGRAGGGARFRPRVLEQDRLLYAWRQGKEFSFWTCMTRIYVHV